MAFGVMANTPQSQNTNFIKFTNFIMIKPVRGFTPQLGKNCFVAENATIVGDVILGDDCSVWFNAVIRGDVNSIRMGNKVNIQDGAVIHCTFEQSKTVVGNKVSIGHNAILHGCQIGDNVLVGMGAIIMDHTVVESNVLIGAGAVVPERSHLESGFVYAGVPAKKLKPLTKENFQQYIGRIADNYLLYASWFKEEK